MLIKVKVFPSSKKEEIIKKSEDSFEVKVKAKPIKGLANKAVIGVLSRYFKIPVSKMKFPAQAGNEIPHRRPPRIMRASPRSSGARIRLVKGFKERNKIFEIQ